MDTIKAVNYIKCNYTTSNTTNDDDDDDDNGSSFDVANYFCHITFATFL